MKKRGTAGFTMIALVIVVLGLIYYTYLNNSSFKQQDAVANSETERLLDYDFETDYPKTARETVKLHCEYLKAAYNGEFSEDELFVVNKNIRQLFDPELLELNAQDKQLEKMKEEIAYYDDNKQRIISFTLPEASQIQYNTEENQEYAKLKLTIALKVDGSTVSADEEYILRKDSEGKWRILGWQAVDNQSDKDKGETKS